LGECRRFAKVLIPILRKKAAFSEFSKTQQACSPVAAFRLLPA